MTASQMPDKASTLSDRLFQVTTTAQEVLADLQRTRTLIRPPRAEPYVMAAGTTHPTVRLALANGQGLDLARSGRADRLTVRISTR